MFGRVDTSEKIVNSSIRSEEIFGVYRVFEIFYTQIFVSRSRETFLPSYIDDVSSFP